jgi:tetratricopeptide (TPR) repeat protein
MQARRAWPPGCQAVFAQTRRDSHIFALVGKYFPSVQNCSTAQSRCLLKYVSAEQATFTSSVASPLELAPLAAGPRAVPGLTASFNHAFYTTYLDPVVSPAAASPGLAPVRRAGEIKEPIPLTIGFYKLENYGKDKAFQAVSEGACAFNSGRYAAAGDKFKEGLAADPSCLRCGYFLAVSYAVLGEAAAAARELKGIDTASPRALIPEHRALIEALLRRDAGAAATIAREVEKLAPGISMQLQLENAAGRMRHL